MLKVEVLKRFFALVCVGIIAFSLAVIGFAHPGKTDEDGGHYNHDTGDYHYHHGYSAHQHPNGECPYNYDYKYNNTHTSSQHNTLDLLKIVFYSFGYALIPSTIAFIFMPKTKNGWLLPIITQIISTIVIIVIWLNL